MNEHAALVPVTALGETLSTHLNICPRNFIKKIQSSARSGGI